MSFDPIANQWRKLLKNGGVGYTETIKTAASVTLTSKNNLMDYVPISGRPLSLVEGRTYTVSVAGDDPDAHLFFPTTECVCVDMSDGAGEMFVIGNQALFDANESEDTGEWFMILEALQDGEWMTMALWGIPSMDTTDSIMVNVTSSTETVHKIDPKFGVLPIVELTSSPTAEGATLTEAESAALTAAANTFLPVAVRFFDAAEQCNIGIVFNNIHGFQLTASLMAGEFVLLNQGGNWVFGVSTTSA